MEKYNLEKEIECLMYGIKDKFCLHPFDFDIREKRKIIIEAYSNYNKLIPGISLNHNEFALIWGLTGLTFYPDYEYDKYSLRTLTKDFLSLIATIKVVFNDKSPIGIKFIEDTYKNNSIFFLGKETKEIELFLVALNEIYF